MDFHSDGVKILGNRVKGRAFGAPLILYCGSGLRSEKFRYAGFGANFAYAAERVRI